MVLGTINELLIKNGYRFLSVKPDEIDVFYKYYQEGFHVVMTVDLMQGYRMVPEQQRKLEERIKNLFFHPQGTLPDFPDGFPVYHVETLTLLVGTDEALMRDLCANCQNIWAYHSSTHRIMIYENQPGDFWGLKNLLENQIQQGTAQTQGQATTKASAYSNRKTDIKKMPLVTIAVIAANIITFLVLEMMGDTENGLFIASHGGMYPDFVRYEGEWWRIITAGFIHFGVEHLANNMVIFACVGSRLEQTIGHWKMAAVYMLSELGGGLLSYAVMLHTGDYAVSAGASGAVFGIIGGLLWAVIWHKGKLEGLTTRGLLFMIGLSLYFGFTAAGVDNWAHIGGMITGFVVTALIYHRKTQKC